VLVSITAIATLLFAASAWGAYPGGNGLVAVSKPAGEFYGSVWLIDPDSGWRQRLVATSTGEESWAQSPLWAPSGEKLAYVECVRVSGEGYPCEINVVRTDGSDRRLVPTPDEFLGDLTWSPDGRRLAYSYVIGVDPWQERIGAVSTWTGGNRPITWPKPGQQDLYPSWSPDGRLIVFARHEDGMTPSLFLVRADGSGLRRLTSGTSPDWSPDGERILFAWGNGVYTIRADGSDRTRRLRVTGARGASVHPRWSPDGRRIVYQARCRAFRGCDVIVSDAYGQRARPIAREGFDASWQPLP
jgi:TolB protein